MTLFRYNSEMVDRNVVDDAHATLSGDSNENHRIYTLTTRKRLTISQSDEPKTFVGYSFLSIG